MAHINETQRRMEKLATLLTLVEQLPTTEAIHELIQDVRNEFRDAIAGDQIMVRWHIDDIIHQAMDSDNIELTEEQARNILIELEHYHDAEQGINWDVISVHIDQYLNGKWQEA